MATEIIMPKAGMDMEEGTIIQWLKNVGDKVEVGDPILEILTDKVNMEVEAEVEGTLLNIKAQPGEVLPVFTVIGYIGKEGEEIVDTDNVVIPDITTTKDVDTKVDTDMKVEKTNTSTSNESEKVRATPAARKIAREKDIDISTVSGSGPLGRVQKKDVEDIGTIKATPLAKKIADVEGIDLANITGTGVGGKITKEDLIIKETSVATPEKQQETVETKKKDNIIPMIGLRKIIADRMVESLKVSAPVNLEIEVDMTNASAFREKIKARVLKETENKVTLTDLIIMATSKALMKYPLVNATLVKEGIRINESVNMGIAVGLDNGLLVPVIKGTDTMTLKDITINRTDTVKRTLGNKVKPDELQGSTFTISNLGMFDTISFNSIINQPNSAILSVGTIVKRMRIIADEPQIRSVMNLSVTIDHRVMDGLVGAQFLQYLKDLLEDPSLLLL